jgi:hypothetical protein
MMARTTANIRPQQLNMGSKYPQKHSNFHISEVFGRGEGFNIRTEKSALGANPGPSD